MTTPEDRLLHISIIAFTLALLMPLSVMAEEIEASNPSPSVPALLSPAEASAWLLPAVEYPITNLYSKNKQELGRRLFFDPRISGNPSKTCATCHHPGLGWADGMARAMANQQGLGRHTPSLLNSAYEHAFFWDGRAASLEDAVSQDLLSPGMLSGETARSIVVRIAAIAAYRQAFNEAFASEGVSFERITAALSTFVRSIVSAPSPFDRWLQGDAQAISASAKRGFALFRGKAACIRCHSGPAFTDSSFHNTGINTVDPGHYEISGKDEDRNAFKTPGLRDIAITPPYMHNGSKKTLADVIDFYDRGGDTLGSGNQLKALHLSAGEKKDLLAFLFSLSGNNRETRVPALPVALNP